MASPQFFFLTPLPVGSEELSVSSFLRTTAFQRSVCSQRRTLRGRRWFSETHLKMPGFLASPLKPTPSSLMLGCEYSTVFGKKKYIYIIVIILMNYFFPFFVFLSWLVFGQPFFQGNPRVLEVGGYSTPAAWGVDQPYVGSVHPLKIVRTNRTLTFFFFLFCAFVFFRCENKSF